MKRIFNILIIVLVFAVAYGCNTNTETVKVERAAVKHDSVSLENSKSTAASSMPKPDGPAIATATAYLQAAYKKNIDQHLIDDNSRRFLLESSDINNDGKKEIFIRHTGSYFCGSDGCTLSLLHDDGTRITTFTVTEHPVLVSKSKHNDWNDLLLKSKNSFHRMVYKGKKYPDNPSVQPEVKDSSELVAAVSLFEDESQLTWHKF